MTIVAFHRVTDTIAADGLTCGSAKFEAFCKFFAKYFDVVPLAEQVRACRAGRLDGGGTLSITFDDGYLDNFEVAAPILKGLRLPATFFVTTGFVGSEFVPSWDRGLARQPGWMNWDQIRGLRDWGFEIGNHTESHLDMGIADSEAVRGELVRSKARLLSELECETTLFAYPFGGREHISASSRKIVIEAGFDCCLSCHGGTNAAGSDPYALNRIGVAEWFATPDQFGYELLAGKA